jgi:hypothetical protein
MANQPIITEHNPVFQPYRTPEEWASDAAAHKRDVQAASREVAEREAAYLKALSPPRAPHPEPPPLRQPLVTQDFGEHAATLDQQICERGVAIDRDRIISLGRERFAELLALDRTVRISQRIIGSSTDLTSWQSVEFAFSQAGALTTQVPKRTMSEELSGSGLDRHAAAQIKGFDDLFKASGDRQSVRDVLAFHDAFVRLVFGQSLFERLSADGRLRSHFFCGGTGGKVALFSEWAKVLDGDHFAVTLRDPLLHLFAWLANEQTPLPLPADFACECYNNVRSLSPEQIKVACAVLEGFVLDHQGWALWDYVGRRTRCSLDEGLLETWRKELWKRFKAIAAFHEVLRHSFNKPVTRFGEAYFQFDAQAHRSFIDGTVAKLLQTVSALAAQAVEETHAVVGRFEDSLLIEGKPKQTAALVERITSKLAVAFPSSAFNVTIEEIA